MDNITPAIAKRIIATELQRLQLPILKLTARTVSFSDLARGQCIFVRIHNWQPNPLFEELRKAAVTNGFRVEA